LLLIYILLYLHKIKIMWDKLKSFFNKIKSILMTENNEVKNSEDLQSETKTNKKTYRFEIGDNVYWILWWFGIFTLMFFEKC
jgi:hypothetical protein